MNGERAMHTLAQWVMWTGVAIGVLVLIILVVLLTGWLRNRRDLADLDAQDAAHAEISSVRLPDEVIAVLQEKTVMVPILDHEQVDGAITHSEFDERFSFVYWEADLQFEDTLSLFGLKGDELRAVVAMSAAGRESAVTGEIPAIREAVAA